MLGKMIFGIPLEREQLEIEKKIRLVSKYIEYEDNNLQKLLAQKAGLMHDLLTGKVPVKVNPDEMKP